MIRSPGPEVLIPETAILAFLLLQGISDLRRKQILVLPSFLFGAAGIIRILLTSPAAGRASALLGAALALLPGALFLIMSRLTRGGIGSGDGLCLLCLAPYLPLSKLCLLLLWALFLSAVFAGLLMLKKKGRNYAYPFIPFLFLAECIRFLTVLSA